jgi:hypothetical protein
MNKITLGFFLAKSKTTIKGLLALFVFLLMNTQASWGQYSGSGTFTKITSDAELTDGYYVVAFGTTFAMNNTNAGVFFANTAITPSTNVITNPTSAIVWKIQTHVDGGRTIYNEASTKYVSYTGTANAAQAVASVTGGSERWTFAWATSIFTVANIGTATRLLKYNTGSPRFACYTTGQQDITLYKMAVSGSASPTLTADATSNTVDNPIDITFTDASAWRTAVTAVKIGTTTLTSGTDYDLTAGNLQLKPSGLNALLTASGSKAITVVATGYSDATVTQVINAGVPTANSTAAISAALAPNTSRTITCTAKDQYNNLVSGYTFKYDAAITNNDSTTAESYTLDGAAKTATATDVSLVAVTNASGVATFTATLPVTIDGNDGISIQAQLSDGTTNIGSAFAFSQLASQTITFGALTPVTYGDATFGLTATASSTLPVSYTSSNTAVATVSGSTVTIVGAGSTNITASQAGNGSYNAATNVIQSLTVNTIALTLPDAVATSKVYTGTDAAVITGNLAGIINSENVTLIGTGIFADVNVADGIAVTSTSTLGGTKAGNYTLTQPTGLIANITQATQTITFGALANKTMGSADYSPGATSLTSGTNAITYASSNTAVATIVSGLIHIVGVGSTNITASQAGSLNYSAAADVVQSLTVVAAPIAAWQFGSPASIGSEVTYNATTNDTNLNTVVLSRGAGILPTALGRGFAANSWDNAGTKTTAVSTGEYFEFVINVKSGYKLNLTALDATLRRSGATAPNAYIWKYSTDGTNFTEIGTDVSYTGTTEGVSQPQIDLSAITVLQNVLNATSLTFRLYAWGGTSTGATFSIGRYVALATTNSLSITGNIEAITSTTWTGSSWTNGAPTASVDAIIAADYSVAANITAKTLTVNNSAIVTIPSGNNVTVTGAVTVTAPAIFTLSNNANLIQGAATTTNSNVGAITVKRNSNALKRLDYTMWSSPVSDGTQTLAGFSPLTSRSPISRFYVYDNTQGAAGLYSSVSPTTPFATGTGYLIRMPNEDPANLGTSSDYYLGTGTPTITYNGVFTGVPNNGDVTLNVTSGTYNAVGNPYPSTIDADKFLLDNSIISGTDALYFWRKSNNSANSSYATYTTAGGTANSGDPLSIAPDATIQVGQGFIAKSTSATLKFTNSMRTGNTGNKILKTKLIERNRIWLNLSSEATPISQMMVAYMTGATQGIDPTIDGSFINDSKTALNSLISNEEYVIQGRSLPFDGTDVVPLAFKTATAGKFTIAIDHTDGLFAAGQDIYLLDSATGSETDLKAGSYTFDAAAGVDNARFSLKYQKTLKVDAPSFNENSVAIYKNKGTLYVNSGAVAIANIKVYDIQGRLIAEQKNVKANTATISNLKATQQVLIVKVTGQDNSVVSKKVLN